MDDRRDHPRRPASGRIGVNFRTVRTPAALDLDRTALNMTAFKVRESGFSLLPELEAVRAAEPVTDLSFPEGVRVWLVTGSDHVREVLSSPATFSSSGSTPEPVSGQVGMDRDGPGHPGVD